MKAPANPDAPKPAHRPPMPRTKASAASRGGSDINITAAPPPSAPAAESHSDPRVNNNTSGNPTAADARASAADARPGADPDEHKKSEKRAAIRRAAYLCFSNKGYHQTTVDDICKAAGISKGSFYWYFDGKQPIFYNILDTWGAEVEAELGKQFKSALAVPDAFAAVQQTIENELKRNRRVMPVWLEFLSQVQREPEIRASIEAFHNRIHGACYRLLHQLIKDRLSTEDINAIARICVAGFIGLLCEDLVAADDTALLGEFHRFMGVLETLVKAMLARAPDPSSCSSFANGSV